MRCKQEGASISLCAGGIVMEGECSTEAGSMLDEKGPIQGEGSTLENKSSTRGEEESEEEDEDEDDEDEDEEGGLIFEEEYDEGETKEEEDGEEDEEDVEEDEEDDEEDSMPEEEGLMRGEVSNMHEQDVLMQAEGLLFEEPGSMKSEMVTFTSSTSTERPGGEGGHSENMANIMDLMVDSLDFALDRKDDIEQGMLEDLLASLRKEQQELEAEAERLYFAPSQRKLIS